jgi:hypothetical protein
LCTVCPNRNMNADASVKLIEEMMDLKLQQYAESQMRPTPEVARILHEKRETDRRRLEQIRSELARILKF